MIVLRLNRIQTQKSEEKNECDSVTAILFFHSDLKKKKKETLLTTKCENSTIKINWIKAEGAMKVKEAEQWREKKRDGMNRSYTNAHIENKLNTHK